MLFRTMKGSEGPCDPDTVPGFRTRLPDCWKRNSQTREGHPCLSISIFKFREIYTIDKWLYSFKYSRTLVLCQFTGITTQSGITISDPRKLSLGKGMARALIYCKESDKEPQWRMMRMDKRSNDCIYIVDGNHLSCHCRSCSHNFQLVTCVKAWEKSNNLGGTWCIIYIYICLEILYICHSMEPSRISDRLTSTKNWRQ